jgi:hypothetical protein
MRCISNMTTNQRIRIPPARRILILARSLSGDKADNGLLRLANGGADRPTSDPATHAMDAVVTAPRA